MGTEWGPVHNKARPNYARHTSSVIPIEAASHAMLGALQGKTMVAVTSGANMNFDRLRLVTELADLGANVSSLSFLHLSQHP